jgi:NAD-dependent SIR2 family protein deacetylase
MVPSPEDLVEKLDRYSIRRFDESHALVDMVQRARAVVAFTGAGILTECGFPDFRSPGGFRTKVQADRFADFLSSE